MTTPQHPALTPAPAFCDPAAERRWQLLAPDAWHRAVQADPLGFVADHLAQRDRRAGSIAVVIDCGPRRNQVVSCVHDAPLDPDLDACRAVLDVFVEAALDVRPPGFVARIGLIVHRTGPAVPADLDQRWAEALADACGHPGVMAMGVVTRTAGGHLLRLPAAA